MAWTQFLDRPEQLEGLFKYGPLLAGFRLAEISWDYDEGACLIRGALSQFADFPQPNWEDDANRVGLRLRLEGVEDFEFEGPHLLEPIDLSLEAQRDGALLLLAEAEELKLRVRFVSLKIDDIFAFHSRDRP